jgi:hypothetical protein
MAYEEVLQRHKGTGCRHDADCLICSGIVEQLPCQDRRGLIRILLKRFISIYSCDIGAPGQTQNWLSFQSSVKASMDNGPFASAAAFSFSNFRACSSLSALKAASAARAWAESVLKT